MSDRDDIIKMAREAGLIRKWMDLCKKDEEALARFTALVRADEREACAKVCERQVEDFKASLASVNHMEASTKRFVIELVEIFSSQCAAAIRGKA